MTGYIQTNLQDLIDELGEDRVVSILSNFSCPLNKDVEEFIKRKAIIFSKQNLSKTYIVFASYKDNPVMVGYFTLAFKFIHITRDILSKTYQKKISKFAQYDIQTKRYMLSAPLIAQLGKNFNNGYNKLITGDELLKLACDKVEEIQRLIGTKVTYLECEEKDRLLEFYSENGFVNFGKRRLDKDETEKMSGEYLVQMLKYL